MKKSTLCFCIKDDQILLAMKKRGFGFGKWNGYGGKIQENETPKASIARELKEESSLIVDEKDLNQVAIINFYFEDDFVFKCYVYMTNIWQGNPMETEEMSPQWFLIKNIPFDKMWVVDAKWIPLVLNGEKIEGKIIFNFDGSILKEFSYKFIE